MLLLSILAASSAATVEVVVDPSTPLATFSPSSLTAVCIDACALKQGLDLSDPRLVALTRNLGSGVLRLGGTDQNTWFYNLSERSPYAKKNCSCGGWERGCGMTATQWEGMLEFGAATGRRVLFGLAAGSKDPENDDGTAVANASALVAYTKALPERLRSALEGWTFGNELVPKEGENKSALALAMRSRIEALKGNAGDDLGGVLVAPDVGIGPRALWIEPSDVFSDEKIRRSLAYLKVFAEQVGDLLDAISWHTYDFRAEELGVVPDDSPLPAPPPANVSKFHDPDYLNVFDALADAVEDAVENATVWLTESDTVNHHGVPGLTNCYGNSVWLAHRLGKAAARGLTFHARQSLIGFDYPLLDAALRPNPDYFLTVLFRQLVGTTALEVASTAAKDARVFAFCADEGPGVVLLAVSLDASEAIFVDVRGLSGRRFDYVLAPDETGLASTTISLNGAVLAVSETGELPDMSGEAGAGPLRLAPLGIAFSHYADAQEGGACPPS